MEITQTLEYIIKAIVDTPDEVAIESTVTEDNVTNLLISAPEGIIGQIIGKQGRIIKSIRTLLNLAYPDIRYNLEIKE
jgi:predicted RNA-binding protein YlqC (UPF0109 family)